MYHFNKPSGPMQEDIRRAVEELVDRNNPHLAITIINNALANTEFSVQGSVSTTSTTPTSAAVAASTVPTTASPPMRTTPGVVAGQVVHAAGSTSATSTSPSSTAAGGGGNSSVVVGTVRGVATTGTGSSVAVGRQVKGIVATTASSAAGGSGSLSSVSAGLSTSNASTYGGGGSNNIATTASVTSQASSASTFPYPRRALERFNPVQLERLLLLRSDAHALTFSHEKSLKDALAAVEVSGHQSPLAYFTVGRQHRSLWAIEDAVVAFNMAETLFSSIVHAYLHARSGLANAAAGAAVAAGANPPSPSHANSNSTTSSGGGLNSSWSVTQCLEMAVWNRKQYGGGWVNARQVKSDEEEASEFWAALGFSPEEVALMGMTPMEYELQQAELQRSRELHRKKQAAAAAAAAAAALPDQLPASANQGRSSVSSSRDPMTTATATTDVVSSSRIVSPTPREEWMERGDLEHVVDHPEDQLSDLELITLFGMDHHEVSVWRRLATEARALLAVNVSQTIASPTLSAGLTTLMPKVNNVRNGVIVAIENGSSQTLRFVGATLNGCAHLPGNTFPRTIPKGHVGLLLLQATAWTGYHGSVCFELDEDLLNSFLYFDVPMLSSKKVGVRLVEHRAADLRVAYDEVNQSLNLNPNTGAGGAGGPPSPPPSSSTTTVTAAAAAAATTFSSTVPKGAAATTAGVRLVKIPSPSVWLASHTANSAQRRIKVVGRAEEGRVVHFVVAEIPPELLTPVEILPALEYAGPHVLKRLSRVSRAYRRLVNNLPPSMFSAHPSLQQQQQLPQHSRGVVPRVSYPDYVLAMDRYSSPWVVRDRGPVQWRMLAEARLMERVEYSVVDVSALSAPSPTSAVGSLSAAALGPPSSGSPPILWITSEIQSRDGTFFHGDPQRRSLLAHVRDHWSLFMNNMFCCETPNGSQFAKITQTSAGLFQLTFEGYGSTPEQVFYAARKHFARPVNSGSGVTGSRYQDPVGTHNNNNNNNNISSTTVGAGAVRSTGTAARYTSGRVISTTSATNSPAGNASATASFSAAAAAQKSSLSTSTPPTTTSPPMSTTTTTTNTTNQEVHYSVWRPRQECGASLVNCPPQNTNGGEELIAEIVTLPQSTGRRAPVAELHLNPGADALLVTLLCYGILRW